MGTIDEGIVVFLLNVSRLCYLRTDISTKRVIYRSIYICVYIYQHYANVPTKYLGDHHAVSAQAGGYGPHFLYYTLRLARKGPSVIDAN